MAHTSPVRPTRRRWLVAGAVVAGLVVAWTAFGFLVAPSLVRRAIVAKGSEALKREVAVARVRINPLALSITVEGFSVKHRDGAPFLGWESLYVRIAPQRLLLGEVGIAEIRLVRPAVSVGLRPDGTLTFQDLLDAGGPPAAAPAPAPAKKPEGGGVAVRIGRLAVEEAKLSFTDGTRKPAFESTMGPLTVRLENFETKGGADSPYSFAGTTDAGETFRWTGTLRTQPFRSAGTLAFERIALPRYTTYAQDEYPIVIHDGRLDYSTAYDLEWGDTHKLTMTGGKLAVDGLAVGPRGGTADVPVKVPRIDITGIDTDVVAKQAKVGEVAFRNGSLRVRVEPDGKLELMRMMPPPSEGKWQWAVGAVSFTGSRIDVEDRSTPRPVALPLTDVEVRLEDLAKGAAHWSQLSFSTTWAGAGKLAVKGRVQPLGDQGALQIDAADLDLVPLAPYLEPDVKARLVAGRIGAAAKVSYDLAAKPLRWTFAGDVHLDGLSVAEAGNEELLRWRALELQGIDAASTRRASLRAVRLVEPRAKVYLWEDGATSIARAFGAKPAGAGAKAPAAGPAWRTAVGLVQVVRGRATFVDRSVTPTAIVNVTGADAKVSNLSSDPNVRSDVDVRLEIEGASPVRIAGTLNPLQKEAYTDLTVTSKGVDLSPLGPYAGKHLGYGIQKGKLDLDLRYKIENRNLVGANLVTLNQFTLGEATNSPDATKLPVRLALALLQDRNGVILLDVPIEGKLDDPEFRLGRVIWHTILNILVKVATSPFSALASLVGGDKADLSLVEFKPGTAEPLPEAKERWELLAKSLAQRPALGLEVEGAAGPEADGASLRHAALERALKRAKAATMRPAPANPDEVTLPSDERSRLVREAFDAAFPGAARKPGEAPPAQLDMEERLASAQAVPADAYRALAAERAQRAREALVAAGLDQSRLFLVQGGERAQKEKGARAYFTVK